MFILIFFGAPGSYNKQFSLKFLNKDSSGNVFSVKYLMKHLLYQKMSNENLSIIKKSRRNLNQNTADFFYKVLNGRYFCEFLYSSK